MAEILFKAVDATNPDGTKDVRGCYKRGDPVLVRDDGWPWGAKELLPPAQGGKFVRVRITDRTAAQIATAVQNRWGVDIDSPETSAGALVRRRLLRLRVDDLPAGVRNQLNTTGLYETDFATARNFIRNKLTGEDL